MTSWDDMIQGRKDGHYDRDGNEIKVGDTVRIALEDKYCTVWGPMKVKQLSGKRTVVVVKNGKNQIPCYMARHLRKIDV
jgi:ribosomal protein S17